MVNQKENKSKNKKGKIPNTHVLAGGARAFTLKRFAREAGMAGKNFCVAF